MANILLFGAGFSANWNAPLARDFFNWLLERPELRDDATLKDVLWRYKDSGGFENALSAIQAEYLRARSAESRGRLERFQQAINSVFSDMDASFAKRADWDFSNSIGRRFVDFFVGFDAIFTLNQDLLFERFYINDNVMLAAPGKWNGCVVPGMRMLPNNGFPVDPGNSTWVPHPVADFAIPARCQPYFKLHGSYRWRDADGGDLMIMGGGKGAAIQAHPILSWYQAEFRRYLTAGDTKLMVVGYGFGDQHINEMILVAENAGLRLFIVDPLGVDVADPTRSLPVRMPNPFRNMIGSASQVPFSRTFADNDAEFDRLRRFIR